MGQPAPSEQERLRASGSGECRGAVRRVHFMTAALRLDGQRFGRLTVIRRSGSRTFSGRAVKAMWLCVCDCGKETLSESTQLKNGTKKSCGCLRKDRGGRSRIDISGQRFGR